MQQAHKAQPHPNPNPFLLAKELLDERRIHGVVTPETAPLILKLLRKIKHL
jgi:hypothetical protein